VGSDCDIHNHINIQPKHIEIEGGIKKVSGRKGKGSLADLFGMWEHREITLKDVREKAWKRN